METIFKLKNFLFSFFQLVDKSLQEELGISFTQFMVLFAVSNNPMGTQVMLAKFRQITPAAISKQLNILLKRKLIVRKNGKKDKREHSITMTSEGKILFKKGIRVFNKTQKLVFKKVPIDSIRKMNHTLDNLCLGVNNSLMLDCK